MPSHHTFALQHHWEWCLDTPCTCCGNQFGSGTSPKCQSSWWLLGVSQRSIRKNPLTVHQLEQHIKLTPSFYCRLHCPCMEACPRCKPKTFFNQGTRPALPHWLPKFGHVISSPSATSSRNTWRTAAVNKDNFCREQVPHIKIHWTLPNSKGKLS